MERTTRVVSRYLNLALVAVFLVAMFPASAFAADWRDANPKFNRHEKVAGGERVQALAASDDIPGVSLPASPFTGVLDAATHSDDVFAVTLAENDTLFLDITGPAKSQFFVYLFTPDAVTVNPANPLYDEETVCDGSDYGYYPEMLFFHAPEAGTYYIDLYAMSGNGAYTVNWEIVPGEADDDISTCATIAPSPIVSTFGEWDLAEVFAVEMVEGDQLDLTLTGSADADLDLAVFQPHALTIWGEDAPRVSSWGETASEKLTLVCPPGGDGTYYVAVLNWSEGAPDYRLAWRRSHPLAPRLSGANRFATSYAISQASFYSAKAAVLAVGNDYPDALAAAGLAGALDCPVLLLPEMFGEVYVSDELANELFALGASSVYIVGGEKAIPADVAAYLSQDYGFAVTRVAGSDRYATSVEVAKKMDSLIGRKGTAFLASGSSFADALAVAPFAFSQGFPILLTPKDTLAPSVRSYLSSAKPKVTIVGGTAVVGSGVRSQVIAATGNTCDRIAGDDRYQTAVDVANYAIDGHGWGTWSSVGIAAGTNFPDALSGGPALGSRGGALLLTDPKVLSRQAAGCLATHKSKIGQAFVLGGTAVVTPGTKTSAEAALK